MFERTKIMAKFVESHVDADGFIPTVQLFFKVKGCKNAKMIQCIAIENKYGNACFGDGIEFINNHKIGDNVEIIKVGTGKYAGYRLA